MPMSVREKGPKRALKGAWRAGVHRILVELPLLVWLVLVWGALWRNFSAANLIFGLVIALVLVRSFRLPAIRLSGRLHLIRGAVFLLWFAWHVVLGSCQVLWAALRRGRNVHNAIIRVPLRSRDDLILTATGHVTSLIPGSLVVEVDRRHSILFLHVLDVNSAEQAERFRSSVLASEAKLVRVMGSRQDLARIEEAEREDAGTGTVSDGPPEGYKESMERRPR